jgi:hypothetical protein
VLLLLLLLLPLHPCSAQYDLGDAALADIIEADLLEQLMEEVELLQVGLF